MLLAKLRTAHILTLFMYIYECGVSAEDSLICTYWKILQKHRGYVYSNIGSLHNLDVKVANRLGERNEIPGVLLSILEQFYEIIPASYQNSIQSRCMIPLKMQDNIEVNNHI